MLVEVLLVFLHNFNPVHQFHRRKPSQILSPEISLNPSAPVVLDDLSSNDFGAALDATNFAANGAALLTFDDTGTTRTFLAINDSTDGFDNRRDAVI